MTNKMRVDMAAADLLAAIELLREVGQGDANMRGGDQVAVRPRGGQSKRLWGQNG